MRSMKEAIVHLAGAQTEGSYFEPRLLREGAAPPGTSVLQVLAHR